MSPAPDIRYPLQATTRLVLWVSIYTKTTSPASQCQGSKSRNMAQGWGWLNSALFTSSILMLPQPRESPQPAEVINMYSSEENQHRRLPSLDIDLAIVLASSLDPYHNNI